MCGTLCPIMFGGNYSGETNFFYRNFFVILFRTQKDFVAHTPFIRNGFVKLYNFLPGIFTCWKKTYIQKTKKNDSFPCPNSKRVERHLMYLSFFKNFYRIVRRSSFQITKILDKFKKLIFESKI